MIIHSSTKIGELNKQKKNTPSPKKEEELLKVKEEIVVPIVEEEFKPARTRKQKNYKEEE